MSRGDASACARCKIDTPSRACQEDSGQGPRSCPTLHQKPVLDRALKALEKPEIYEFARQASIQEAKGYEDRDRGYDRVRPVKPRILETIEFARRMNYRKLGLVFCMGLRREAQAVEGLFSDHGFEMISAGCKIGRVPKEKIGIREDEKIRIGAFESMCNPIAQAMVLNEAETEFNIVMGLCVGHDSLFLRYAQAPCTVLAVKDRVLGHNPLAAVYTLDSYYRSLKNSTGKQAFETGDSDKTD